MVKCNQSKPHTTLVDQYYSFENTSDKQSSDCQIIMAGSAPANSVKVLDELNPASKIIKKERNTKKNSREHSAKIASPVKAITSLDTKTTSLPQLPLDCTQDEQMRDESGQNLQLDCGSSTFINKDLSLTELMIN